MASQNYQQTFEKINKLINSSRYNESFLLLKSRMNQFPGVKKELEKLKQSESTYRYMLDYIAEGNQDPSREDMMEQIRDVLHEANDVLRRESKLTDSRDIYSATRRLEQLRQSTIYHYLDKYKEVLQYEAENDKTPDKIKISPAQARVLDEIFNYVWTMNGVDNEEYEALSQALDSQELPDHFKALMISAIILGNLAYFDSNSFEILLNQYETTGNSTVKARTMIGIILISLLHAERISGNLSLRSRLLLSNEDDHLKKVVDEVLTKIIRTYDTKRIDNKMRNEVIPGLMKIQPEIIDKFRNLTSDSEDILSNENPQWEEMIENSGLGEKLQEINDMQMEGADVMVTAFSNLKSFPFFNQISNWFMPFIPGHYEFDNLPIENDGETVDRLTTVMCDSDLNSFMLSMKSLPQDHRDRMISNMEHQMKEAKEALSNAVGETESDRLSKKINHSLQDLYRFFKFYRKKDDFFDPFGNPFLAKDIEPLMPLFGINPETVKLIAEFYFKNKYYDEASGMFELVDSLQQGDFNVWEKIGYSHDRMQRYDKAVEWYLKADLVSPGSPWLVKQLALSLKNAGRGKEAKEYYEKALENSPENYHLLMSAGQCLLDNGDLQGALKHFYHAQYLKPEKSVPQKAIAWTELMAGNYDKAIELYNKILESDKADLYDTLNAAHSYLAKGDFKNALRFYRDFVEKTENKDITKLVIALRDDAEALRKIGISTSDLRLIIDKIRYDMLG